MREFRIAVVCVVLAPAYAVGFLCKACVLAFNSGRTHACIVIGSFVAWGRSE